MTDRQAAPITDSPPVLVSIVTPSFQQGRFLRQCIESVLAQDYPHIEYFVMDGGSTDESLEILKSYNDRFFWESGPDRGQTTAINSGLRKAKGTFLAYLNSDDILLPGAVSHMVKAWKQRPEVDLFYGLAHIIDETGAILSDYNTAEFDIDTFKEQCYICQPAAFWHRRIMDRVGLFDEKFQYAMDYEYWQRIAANNGKLVRLDRFIACWRDHATTKTRTRQSEVYRDVFNSQWRHWGHVSPQWWRGLLDHWKTERRGGWGRFIPSWKKSARISRFLSRVIRKRVSPPDSHRQQP